MLTQERLKQLLDYNPETGVFTWKVRRAGTARVGAVAGSLQITGYIHIQIDQHMYSAHRLAWLFMHGAFPAAGLHIDHVNGERADNRAINLRVGTHRANMQNLPCHRKGKLPGACWHKRKQKWQALAQLNGKYYSLGYHGTAEAAHEAYKAFLTQQAEPA